MSAPPNPPIMASCCTCASWLDSLPQQATSEKPLRHRELDCCGRVVCQPCLERNPRFANYCPFCPSTAHLQPPAYEPTNEESSRRPSPPPPYTEEKDHSSTPKRMLSPDDKAEGLPSFESKAGTLLAYTPLTSSKGEKADDAITKAAQAITHYLHHPHDSMASLSLKYSIPADILRSYNKLSSDHLLAARRTIAIPPEYAALSLSPDPLEDAQETERKAKIRRFMMSCKCADYDLAVIYLDGAGWDVDTAAGRWVDDEVWERENPAKGKGKGKAKESSSGPFWRRRWS